MRPKKGFTLVELIVVIVILAILAAIAIPALTGYIDKARDKEYIAKARDVSVAIKTVLNEAYASGSVDSLTEEWKGSFTTGWIYGKSGNYAHFPIDLVSFKIYGNQVEYYRQAAALMGEAYPASSASGFWVYYTVAKRGSGATAATADGFRFEFFPDGRVTGKPEIAVTYKLERFNLSEPTYSAFSTTIINQAVYNPNTGYEVYKFTYNL
ncbi:MAG: prepilin-type N-terminal cleavage/methylation domain-containing protein [Clostridiales Family XIII bacterium]|nr:prepilin-type N-terminal cleavage/methylation domain-containing protein [Clostridiales Family XIII bacterium]